MKISLSDYSAPPSKRSYVELSNAEIKKFNSIPESLSVCLKNSFIFSIRIIMDFFISSLDSVDGELG